MPIVVMRDRKTNMTFSNVVPSKGRNAYAIKRVTQDRHILGYGKIIMKDDQEVALKDLRNGVNSESSCTIIPEEAPVKESKSNGELEANSHESLLDEAVLKSIITDTEAKEIRAVREMVSEIIAVDEFEHSVLKMNASSEAEAVTDQAA